MKKEMLNDILNHHKGLIIAIAIGICISITSFSYAYFTAGITNKNVTQTVFTTGNMTVEFDDGNVVATKSNMIPGEHLDKTFTVENKGNVAAYYDIYLNEVDNEFVDKNDLVYELITEDGQTVAQTVCPSTDTMIASNILIDVGETHHYTLRITFLYDSEHSQDDNHGVSFSAKVELEESKFVPSVNQITYYNSNSTLCSQNQTVQCALDELTTLLN